MTATTKEVITSYVTDMLALERHLETALSGQIADLDESPDIVAELRTIQATCQGHIATLDALAKAREVGGQGIAETVKNAAASLLGAGAAAIDFLRGEKLPKDLRDDYAAASLACIGYVMLHTTALSLGDTKVAELAHEHLANHAASVMALNGIVPIAVIRFLREEGHPAQDSVLPEIGQNIRNVWSSSDQSDHAGDHSRRPLAATR